MTPRAIRRAAERLARKQATRQDAATPAIAVPAMPVSEARLAANRANAQLSTGPTTEAGKRISSLNAVKSALTGATVLLPADDVARYEALVASYIAEHQPATDAERRLVQGLADTQWRLARIPALETAIFARGRIEFADKFHQYDPDFAASLTDSETIVVYEKQLRNLHTQEARLQRNFKKDYLELTALTGERRKAEAEAAATVAAAEAETAPSRKAGVLKPAPSQTSLPPMASNFQRIRTHHQTAPCARLSRRNQHSRRPHNQPSANLPLSYNHRCA